MDKFGSSHCIILLPQGVLKQTACQRKLIRQNIQCASSLQHCNIVEHLPPQPNPRCFHLRAVLNKLKLADHLASPDLVNSRVRMTICIQRSTDTLNLWLLGTWLILSIKRNYRSVVREMLASCRLIRAYGRK